MTEFCTPRVLGSLCSWKYTSCAHVRIPPFSQAQQFNTFLMIKPFPDPGMQHSFAPDIWRCSSCSVITKNAHRCQYYQGLWKFQFLMLLSFKGYFKGRDLLYKTDNWCPGRQELNSFICLIQTCSSSIKTLPTRLQASLCKSADFSFLPLKLSLQYRAKTTRFNHPDRK